MGPKSSKLSDAEKLRDLEWILSGKKLLAKPASYALFALNDLCRQNRLTKDIAGYIMKICHQLLSTTQFPKDLLSQGFVAKEFKYSLADLFRLPHPIFSDTEIPLSQQSKVLFKISLGAEINLVNMKGRIKGIPAFQRNFLLDCAQLLADITRKPESTDNSLDNAVDYDALHRYDTEKGIELNTLWTLLFLYDNIYMRSRIR